MSLMDFFIFFSVSLCVTASFICAIIVYRRNSNSNIHKYFAIFFVGLAGFVGFYLFLQDPILKDFSYFFQILCASIAEMGLFFFYYSLAHEGYLSRKLVVLCSSIFALPPLIIPIFHPYSFVEESYGFELSIDPWFMLLVSIVYTVFFFYAIVGLLWIRLHTENQLLKRRLELTFFGLLLAILSALITFDAIPVFLNIHYLKPIGYGLITVAIVIMAYAFKGNVTKKQVDDS